MGAAHAGPVATKAPLPRVTLQARLAAAEADRDDWREVALAAGRRLGFERDRADALAARLAAALAALAALRDRAPARMP
jgi:hypothetical protein